MSDSFATTSNEFEYERKRMQQEERFSRTERLFGKTAMEKLASSRVAVFGLGGVGSYVVEALARGGIGALDLIDHDDVSISNLNRQLIATEYTIGHPKAETAKERVISINPACRVTPYVMKFLPDNAAEIDFHQFDYVVDAVDMVTAKLAIVEQAKNAGVPVISCMGTGNKMNPMAFEVADLYETSVCPLARVMRKECKDRGIEHLKVVYSKEKPQKTVWDDGNAASEKNENGCRNPEQESARVPASNSFVPAAAGLLIASVVLKELAELA